MKRLVLVSLSLENEPMMKFRHVPTLGLLMLGACSSSSLDSTGHRSGDPSPTATSTVTSAPTAKPSGSTNDYFMRFEGFSTVEGKDGLRVGSTTNLRFAFDLQATEQTYYPPPKSSAFLKDTGVVTPKIITFFELGSYCQQGGEQFGPVDLPPGDTAWVDHLDLTMTSSAPVPADGSAPEGPKFNAMCYGYRLNGAWHWELAPQWATWDATTKTYQLRLTIQAGPIDAIKVLSGNGQASRYLDTMVLATKPQ